MRPDLLDLDWITPLLAVGGRFPREAAGALAGPLEIRRVVDLRLEDRDDEADLRAHGILFLHLPILDGHGVPVEVLEQGIGFASAAMDAGDRVLLHCEYGIGRSALLALCVLVSRGETARGALGRARARRPQILLTEAQIQSYRAWLRERPGGGSSEEVLPSEAELRALLWGGPPGRDD